MIAYWVIPPEADAEFVAGMEDVLDTYAKAYDPTPSRAVHGRTAGAVDSRNAPPLASDQGASYTRRL